ncbi:MAG: N-acetylneuraminate synthase [Pelagibacteraceae bacterium TMED65]|nr:N-acetylneuraminate synthase [Rickettsiales bacterium]OUU52726.1 MAG: N-acetylneuraminate synthase [Pelagibacteraceae bacterium TMED65]
MIKIGKNNIGTSYPIYVIAEIGINHNGDMQLVQKLIDEAHIAGVNAVKFQKRTPQICVPEEQKLIERDTPWGRMSYLKYKEKIELSKDNYEFIDKYCKKKGIDWFASCWDLESLEFIKKFNPVAYKIASASLTDKILLKEHSKLKEAIIISTGMSTMKEIKKAEQILSHTNLLIAHSTSAYPCKSEELNLKVIQTFMKEFDHPIGYSGHELGIQTTLAACVLGACFIERHFTLDRSMWGTDQAASLEPPGLKKLVRDIKVLQKSLGDGIKKVYDSEKKIRDKLRLVK